MKRTLLAIAVLLLVLDTAFGQQGLGDGKWWKRPRLVQALGLSTAQSSELEKIFAKSRPKLIDLKADLEKKQFAYEQAMSAEKVNRPDVEAKIEAREQARAKLQKELALMELDMKQVLTPEQREKVAQFREENRQKMMERRKAMRGGAAPDDAP